MPRCSSCGRNLGRRAFSKNQLRKSTACRCKECVAGVVGEMAPASNAPTATAGALTQRSDDAAVHSSLVNDELVSKLLLRGRVHGVPEHLRNPKDLRKALDGILVSDPKLVWLVYPLIQGLLHGGHHINATISSPFRVDWPILIWVCQLKFLHHTLGWNGGDEIVSMVLAAGVNINVVLDNKCNAAFFAVKYASANTLDLLVEAGINLKQLDVFGRTLLYNALERPSPEILNRVLNHVPATEMFKTNVSNCGDFMVSAADQIISMYSSFTLDEAGRKVTPISWQYLGPPLLEDVVESLIIVRQRGATLTYNEASSVYWASMEYAVSGGKGKVRQSEDLKLLAQSLIGMWFPPSIKEKIEQKEELIGQSDGEEVEDLSNNVCPICLDPFHKQLELYCGHSFCRNCIVEYGRASDNTTCPVCHCILCNEIHPCGGPDEAVDINLQFGLTGNTNTMSYGPNSLDDDQVLEEAKIQGIRVFFSSFATIRSKLVEQTSKRYDEAVKLHHFEFDMNGRTRHFECVRVAELSSTNPLCNEELMLLSPSRGPVMIEIAIKGVPVVASISNNSCYTCISASVVNNFGLKRVECLTSKKFRDALSGAKLKNATVTCLEKFTFSLGGVEVTLRNAVEISPDMGDGAIGVQLGKDFFLSAAWCIVDAATGSETLSSGRQQHLLYIRTDGKYSWPQLGCKGESLRYYAHDGNTAHLPLLHFNPTRTLRVNALTLKQETTYTECNWCCRTFPKGMLVCSGCEEAGEDPAYYCDRQCQKGAWKIHKARAVAHKEELEIID